ncbi:AMP-binding protein [Kitasatospora sp. NPDC086801]|uniref:AMP-binding protein n=1 Tax=Kitasatospora sp. NPDC086801 TaxID=3364066 RepID=UPI0038120ACE
MDIRPALYSRFLRGLAESPHGVAIRTEGETLSYAQVHETALCWAGSLLDGPVGQPAVVGVLAGRVIEGYVGLLAALYAGATVVPLNPEFPAARTGRMIEAAGVRALIADGRGTAVLAELGLDLPVLAPGGGGSVPVLAPGVLHEPLPPGDIAYVLFTSGSTGSPKGVPISQVSALSYFDLLDRRYDFTASDVFSQTFDLNFDCAMFDLFCAWGAGAAVHVVPPHAYRVLPEFAAERGLTIWFSTPSAISLVRRLGGLAPGALPTLRWSFFAGEALPCDDTADWQAAAPSSVVENLYGPTELTVTVTRHRWSPERSRGLAVNGVVPIGAIHEGHEHLLLGEDGQPVDTEGELCVTGPQMTAGYLDPADDHGRFAEIDGRRWYRTGDRVRRLGNGDLAYLGRLDAQVQVQGVRVELAEIDHAVRSCEGVVEAATVARQAARGLELVVFYTGVPTSPAELSRQLKRILPAATLPRHYHHVDELPLNSNRKVDRRALASGFFGGVSRAG